MQAGARNAETDRIGDRFCHHNNGEASVEAEAVAAEIRADSKFQIWFVLGWR